MRRAALLICIFGLLFSVTFAQAKKKPKSKPDAPSKFAGKKAGEGKELVAGMKFRWCPPGAFNMGPDFDAIPVTLTSGFWLGETEVTQGQWKKLMGTEPWKDLEAVREGDDHPANHISYDDALAFCGKLNEQERSVLQEGWSFSCPTEAQWEYACRAGTTTKFSFGDDATKFGDYGWYEKNTKGENYPHSAGAKKPNGWGLKDMHGNVWEWCSDWYEYKRIGGINPQGPKSGKERVYRSGCWVVDAEYCESAMRSDDLPTTKSRLLGFRVAVVFSGK